MLPIIIGIILIILGLFLIPIGYSDFKDELKMVKKERSAFKRIFLYMITFIGFLDLSNYLGYVLSLALLLIFGGVVFIIFSMLY